MISSLVPPGDEIVRFARNRFSILNQVWRLAFSPLTRIPMFFEKFPWRILEELDSNAHVQILHVDDRLL